MVCIYIFTFPNKKKYVGQSTNLKARYGKHRSGKEQVVDKAIRKYGWKNVHKLEMSCPEEYLDWMEQEWIKMLNCIKPKGYNLNSGGNKNKHHSEETKKKISEKHKGLIPWNKGQKETRPEILANMKGSHGDVSGKNNPFYDNHRFVGENNPFYGQKQTDEVKAIISKTHKGIPLSEGHKKKISLNSPKAMLGKHQPEDVKKKIGIANTGNHCSKENKERLSKLNSGPNNKSWKGGVSSKYKRRQRLKEKESQDNIVKENKNEA